jgi:phage antirepressor YoqD-like protein
MSALTITNKTTMSSREIAELVSTSHDSVLKTVRELLKRGLVFGNETTYTHPQNGQTYPQFLLNYRDTMLIASGYSVELRARVIDRWQELEAGAAPKLPQTFAEALRLAAEQAEQIEQQAAALTIAAPKAEALDRLAAADGSMCITDAAKSIGIKPKALFAWLMAHEWIYRRPGKASYLAYQTRIQQGVLEHKVTTVQRDDGTDKVCEQVQVTPKGLARLSLEVRAV